MECLRRPRERKTVLHPASLPTEGGREGGGRWGEQGRKGEVEAEEAEEREGGGSGQGGGGKRRREREGGGPAGGARLHDDRPGRPAAPLAWLEGAGKVSGRSCGPPSAGSEPSEGIWGPGARWQTGCEDGVDRKAPGLSGKLGPGAGPSLLLPWPPAVSWEAGERPCSRPESSERPCSVPGPGPEPRAGRPESSECPCPGPELRAGRRAPAVGVS